LVEIDYRFRCSELPEAGLTIVDQRRLDRNKGRHNIKRVRVGEDRDLRSKGQPDGADRSG